MLKSELQGWFESHPAISIRQFAIECGYSDGGRFRKYMRTPALPGETVSNTILKRITLQLKHYGCNLHLDSHPLRCGFSDPNDYPGLPKIKEVDGKWYVAWDLI